MNPYPPNGDYVDDHGYLFCNGYPNPDPNGYSSYGHLGGSPIGSLEDPYYPGSRNLQPSRESVQMTSLDYSTPSPLRSEYQGAVAGSSRDGGFYQSDGQYGSLRMPSDPREGGYSQPNFQGPVSRPATNSGRQDIYSSTDSGEQWSPNNYAVPSRTGSYLVNSGGDRSTVIHNSRPGSSYYNQQSTAYSIPSPPSSITNEVYTYHTQERSKGQGPQYPPKSSTRPRQIVLESGTMNEAPKPRTRTVKDIAGYRRARAHGVCNDCKRLKRKCSESHLGDFSLQMATD